MKPSRCWDPHLLRRIEREAKPMRKIYGSDGGNDKDDGLSENTDTFLEALHPTL